MGESQTNWDAVLECARNGDLAARNRVLTRLRPIVVRRVRRAGACEADASDVAQETLTRVDEHLDECEATVWTGFEAWAMRIGVNALAESKRRRHLAANSIDAGAGSSVALFDLLFADSPSPSSKAGRKEIERRLKTYISELPERQRSVISLFYVESLTLAEIGRRLGISDDAAAIAKRNALRTLKKRFADGQ